MFEKLKKSFSKNTGLLIRFDDITENMKWDLMKKCENLLDKYKIKPLLGVIPINKDREFLKYKKNSNFWNQVRKWHAKGWEISMHGCYHLYSKDTKNKDYFGYGGKSEFYGHKYLDQKKLIKTGLEKFIKENIPIRSFYAPNHTYDSNTLKAIKNCGIKNVIDGYGFFPYTKNNLNFIPQLFYKEIFLPFGIQCTQIHLNYWKKNDFKKFEKFIKKNKNKIISFDDAIKKINNGILSKSLRLTTKMILQTIRKISN